MINLKIMPDGAEPYELKATTRDIAMWEKTNRGASLAKLQNEMHATDLYAVAFHAAKRQGLFTGTAQEFQDSCDLDVLDDDEPDPTQSAA